MQAFALPELISTARAVVVLSPEHYRIFREAGWDRKRIEHALFEEEITRLETPYVPHAVVGFD